mmetsp:Transcript_91534/g.294145  ORF Transcript_91534/g.294145 Transcript_91534/m.294145 type:complete len:119 (+) Transcript_91534:572-928(+)
MKAKLPADMHREVILFNSRRWSGADMLQRGAVETAVAAPEVLPRALALAAVLRPKGRGPARLALGGIKRVMYRQVLDALDSWVDMGYGGRTRGVDRAPPPLEGAASEGELRAGARSKL